MRQSTQVYQNFVIKYIIISSAIYQLILLMHQFTNEKLGKLIFMNFKKI